MKIVVCVKQVPDTESKIRLNPQSLLDSSSIKWIVNPYDEIAIEEALKLRDANAGSQIVVVSVGPKKRTGDAVRTALAMGADEGVLIDAPEYLDALDTAHILAQFIKQEAPVDLVLAGKLAIDDNASSIPQMTAQLLSWGHVSVVSKLQLEGGSFRAERDGDGGEKQIVIVKTPCVISANKGLNTPRYASLPGIMKAKKKTLKEIDLAALGVELQGRTTVKGFELPPDKPSAKMLSGDSSSQSKELVRLLKEENKVL